MGNFAGTPRDGICGITGAGPPFRDAMLAAAQRPPATRKPIAAGRSDG